MRWLWAVLVLFFGGAGSRLHAEPSAVAIVIGEWMRASPEDVFSINLNGVLSERQKSLVNSGFATFSQLRVYAVPEDTNPTLKEMTGGGVAPIAHVSCSVRFDTWQEEYDVVNLTDRPAHHSLSGFPAYAGLCLQVSLQRSQVIALGSEHQTLAAVLRVEQISTEEADEIKQWLIRQQSGFIQGLFSHMLGDLTLSEQVVVNVQVPARVVKRAD